ncbi:MAG: cytochrome b [Rhizobiales bacterium]|nr:cytochrome b [Hyphomicrobiales bacterium]
MLRNTKTSWGSVSRGFHWVLGILVIAMLGYGYWMNHFAARTDRFFHRSIHADIGYVILSLLVLRIVWRIFNPSPDLPVGTPRWERVAAWVNHAALYLTTVIVAMLGWAHSGARTPDYASFFGWFRVPQFTAPDKAAARAYEENHVWGAYILMALVALHILAALYHYFIRRDRVLMRMADGRSG